MRAAAMRARPTYCGIICGGIASIIGHNWPAAFGFKGGKGISTSFGVILVLQPYDAPWLLLVMAIALYFTKTVSIGSICAAATYAIINIFQTMLSNTPVFVFSVIVAAMAIFQHRANISRLETKSGRGRAGKAFLFCALVIGCVGICMICR